MPLLRSLRPQSGVRLGPLGFHKELRTVGHVRPRETHPAPATKRRVMNNNFSGCCFEDQDIEEAERVMEKTQIRRLPVLDRDKRIVGIATLGDLAIKDDENGAGVTSERVSEHSQ